MPVPWLLLIFGTTFGLVLLGVLATRRILEDRQNSQGEAGDWDWGGARASNVLLKDDQLSTISFWHSLLARINGVEIMKARIAEAGLEWSVGRLTAMMLLAGASVLVLASRINWLPLSMTAVLSAVAGLVPYWMVLRRRSRRLMRIQTQLPDALDSLSQSLRAGNSLAAAITQLARELPAPLGVELMKLAEEHKLGMNWEIALENLNQRVPAPEIHVFSAAVLLQSKTGGKLHEVLGRLSESMREAEALRGEVRAITAHGRLSGLILTILPIGITLLMAFLNPGYLAILWHHPWGKDLILVAVGCLVTAQLVISRLIQIRI